MPQHRRRTAIHVKIDDEVANAREGVVFFWSQIDPVLNRYTLVRQLEATKITQATTAAALKRGINDPHQSRVEYGEQQAGAFKRWAYDLVQKLFSTIGFDITPGPWLGWIADNLISHIGPFLGSIVGGVKGLIKFGTALVQKVRLWWQGRKVELQAGHPQAIARGIGELVNNAMLEGLYKTAKAAVSASLTFVSAGASALISGIAGEIELTVRMIYTVKEAMNIDAFIAECKEIAKLPKGALVWSLSGDAEEFNEMFLRYTNKAPIIAAITYNTLICGDKMRFLKMISGDGTAISQSGFDAGCTYLDTLKETGRSYCSSWGKNLKSSDDMVKGLLTLVQHGADARNPKRPWYKRLLRSNKKS